MRECESHYCSCTALEVKAISVATTTVVTGQPGGGNADKTSPLVNFNQHILDDLLPYVFCCRTSLTMVPCDRYEDLRPSVLANAEPYELPVPAAGIVPPPPAPLKTSS